MATMVGNEKASGPQPIGVKVENDMREGFARIDQDIRDLRGEIKAQGESLRGEISDLRTELKEEMRSQKAELKEEIGCVRGEVKGHRAEMNARFLALETSINGLQRTLIGSAICSAGAIVAALIGVKIL